MAQKKKAKGMTSVRRSLCEVQRNEVEGSREPPFSCWGRALVLAK
jgi:hypothetical protein